MSSEAQKRANKRQDLKRRGQPKLEVRIDDYESMIVDKVVGKHGGTKHDAVMSALEYYLDYK